MEKEARDIFADMEKEGRRVKDLITFHIMLIGFMGAGKSTVSSYLSKQLNMEEVDTDSLIVKKEGKKIPQIFEENGEKYFRDCESSILIDLQKRNNLIVSCGGGIVLREENVWNMKKQGRIVLLTATPQTIYERVKDSKERPILNDNMNTEFIAQLMEKRQDKYLAAADIIVATDQKTVEQICDEIIEKLIRLEVKNQ
ncbi:MAG: shikimate kinase [Candidatus Galacturonibacter soehngenii]|nr:shikimate kinase [Candidatus Galacturonibacter soehngenii]